MPNYTGAQRTKSKTSVRIPLLTDEHIDEFQGASITSRSGLLRNGIVDRYAGEKDRIYVTQRPSVSILNDASDGTDPTAGTKGRGMHFWAANNTRYFVNDGKIYKDSYDQPLTIATVGGSNTSLTSGADKVHFAEWSSAYNDYLFIIVPESSQMFVIQATEIGGIGDNDPINLTDVVAVGTTGTGTPFHASEEWDLAGWSDVILAANGGQAGGYAVLDTYLFLATKSGRIYNSGVDNWLCWNSLDFLTAERENDQLLYLDKHKDHVVGFGTKSMELFYDAANTTGSPLSPRKDIYHNIGIVSGQDAWRDGDDIYFLGIKPNGDFHMYTLREYQLAEDSTSTIDSYLKHGRTQVDLHTVLSGFSTGNHVYAILTVFDIDEAPQITMVYDNTMKIWYEWDTSAGGQTKYPLISWSTRTPETPVTAEGIFSNGDIFFVEDNFEPVDAVTVFAAYFLEDYGTPIDAVLGYSSSTTGVAVLNNINLQVDIGNVEFGSTDRKFMHCLKYVGNKTTDAQTLSVEWSDDDKVTWNSEDIDLQYKGQINRMGSFERRAFRLSFSGDEQIRAEAVEVTYSQGTT